jgi:hypothetical protein
MLLIRLMAPLCRRATTHKLHIAHCTSHLTQRLGDDVAADAGLVRAYEEQVLLRKAEAIFGLLLMSRAAA